jgi:hypothetical protein
MIRVDWNQAAAGAAGVPDTVLLVMPDGQPQTFELSWYPVGANAAAVVEPTVWWPVQVNR